MSRANGRSLALATGEAVDDGIANVPQNGLESRARVWSMQSRARAHIRVVPRD